MFKSAILAAVATLAIGSTFADAAALNERMAPAAPAKCEVIISVKTVRSEAKPKGDIEAVLVTGSAVGKTSGGSATSAERCVYYFGPDAAKGSSTPGYRGKEWPYVQVGTGCTVRLDSSVPSDSPLRNPGYVDFDATTRHLRIGGLPVYQYRDDEEGTCLCNEPPEWTSILPDGNGAAFDVSVPAN